MKNEMSIAEKMKRTNEEKREEFEAVAKPVIKFINENYNPHTTVIIGTDSAEIMSGEMSVVTEEFILD